MHPILTSSQDHIFEMYPGHIFTFNLILIYGKGFVTCFVILTVVQRLLNFFGVVHFAANWYYFSLLSIWLFFLSHEKNVLYLPVMLVFSLTPQLSEKKRNRWWLPYSVRLGLSFFVSLLHFMLPDEPGKYIIYSLTTA